MEIKAHDFEISGGEVVEKGKAHWPDCLNIAIPKYRVLGIIQQLARGLEVYNNQEFVPLSFMGKLDYDIDEDAEQSAAIDAGDRC